MKVLHISYLEHKTNDWVPSKINFPVAPQELLLATVQRRKLAWFGHVTRHDSLSKTIPQGTVGGDDAVVGREKMLDGQHQRVDIPVHVRTAHNNGLLQKKNIKK